MLETLHERQRELREIKRAHRKDSQRHEFERQKDAEEIRRLEKRCEVNEEAVRNLKDSRKHIDQEHLLKENRRL